MAELTEEWLDWLGLADLCPEDKLSLLAAVREEHQTRVEVRQEALLTARQLHLVHELQATGGGELVSAWLEENVPERQRVIRVVALDIEDELRSRAAEILEGLQA